MSFPVQISKSVYAIGVTNPNLRVFDVIMETKYGTSYNAYLIRGEKNVLVETVHARFFDEYLENITSLVPVAEIDYLVLNHTEPDHTGSVAKLLALNPNITVVGSAAALSYTEQIANTRFSSRAVKTGDTLEIGGRQLSFISAPLLHWPDTIFTWLADEKVMFTCDFLGAHYCEPRVLDSHIHYPADYEDAFAFYYTAIMSPFKPHVMAGLSRLKGYAMDFVCTSHGPVLTGDNIARRMALYEAWSAPKPPREKKQAAILYVSAYGATGALACQAQTTLEQAGIRARAVDIITVPLSEVAALIAESDYLLMGSCTINRDAPKPVWDALATIDAITCRGKKAAVFGSYGWSGEACAMIRARLLGLGFLVPQEPQRVHFIPSQEELAQMAAFTEAFIATL